MNLKKFIAYVLNKEAENYELDEEKKLNFLVRLLTEFIKKIQNEKKG